MLKRLVFFLFLIMDVIFSQAQSNENNTPGSIRFLSVFTSFPDSLRIHGHTYRGVPIPFDNHYDDKTVLVIIPPEYNPHNKVDMVFWFHGWYNSIDSSLQVFKLADQFLASKREAILVIPETAKNAPDSYGGKLENSGMFQKLVTDVLTQLEAYGNHTRKYSAGNIILAGHSGAYRLIAHIIHQGGIRVQEVLLFDGLYGQLDKFKPWLLSDKNHSFVHWYTNKGGGTDEVSDTLMNQFKRENIAFKLVEETIPETQLPKKQQILFIHSTREHNDVITNPDNFKLLLQRSKYLRKIKK